MRWVCIHGFGSCRQLASLGMPNVTQVESRDEATYMVKLGLADGYWRWALFLSSSALTIATSANNRELTERIWQAYQRISVTDSRLRLAEADSRFKVDLLLEPAAMAWLKQKKVIRFAVAPSFYGISEIDEEGRLHGYAADLMKLISLRSGVRFEMVPIRTSQD